MDSNIRIVGTIKDEEALEQLDTSLVTLLGAAVALDNVALYKMHKDAEKSPAKQSGLTPLHVAAISNVPRFVSDLAAYFGLKDSTGSTALMYACKCNSLEFVHALSLHPRFREEQDAIDAENRPTLHYAIAANNLVLEQFFLGQVALLGQFAVLVSHNLINLLSIQQKVKQSEVFEAACDAFYTNSFGVLRSLTNQLRTYEEEVAALQREISAVQWKRYLIQRPENAGIGFKKPQPGETFKKDKDFSNWQATHLQAVFSALNNGCQETRFGARCADGLTPLLHLVQMRVFSCMGGDHSACGRCEKMDRLQLLQYLDFWRYEIARTVQQRLRYTAESEKTQPLCSRCNPDEFCECFRAFFDVARQDAAICDQEAATSALHLFLLNFDLVGALDAATVEYVISSLRGNYKYLDKRGRYPLMVFSEHCARYGKKFGADFLGTFVAEAEVDSQFVKLYFAQPDQSLELLLPIIEKSKYLAQTLTKSLQPYQKVFLLWQNGSIEPEVFMRVAKLSVESNEAFFASEISPLYDLDFQKPYARKTIQFLLDHSEFEVQKWFQRLLIMPGQFALQKFGKQLLNPISRILQLKDAADQQLCLQFYNKYSERLSGECYNKKGVVISPYNLCLHDRRVSAIPELFIFVTNSHQTPAVEEVQSDTNLITLIKRGDYRDFCARCKEMARDIGKFVKGQGNTALIQFTITFGHQDVEQCQITADMIRAEHGCCDKDGHTAAFYATKRQNARFVGLLLEYEDEWYFPGYNDRKNQVRTALHEACITLNCELISRIVERFPKLLKVNSSADQAATPVVLLLRSFELQYAQFSMRESEIAGIIALLLQKQSASTGAGHFPLSLVLASQVFPRQTRENLVEVLAKHDKSDWVTPEGYNQLMLCAKYDVTAGYQYYKRLAGQTSFNNEFAALIALRSSSTKMIFKLLPQEHHLKHRGCTLLHIAVQMKRADVALYIAEKQLCLRERDDEGRTALMLAIQQKMDGLVAILTPFESGICDKQGRYGIHYAINANNKIAFKKLFAAEANAVDGDGNSLLQYTLNTDQDETTKFALNELMQHLKNARDYAMFLRQNYSQRKQLSLHQQLVLKDHQELFSFILKYDQKIWNSESHTQDIVCQILALQCVNQIKLKYITMIIDSMLYSELTAPTPLMFAAVNGIELSEQLFALLYAKEASKRCVFNGRTPLELAVLSGNYYLLAQLLSAAKGKFDDSDKKSILVAAQTGNSDALPLLAQFAGFRNSNQETALMLSAARNDVPSCKILLPMEAGLKNDQGLTALAIAITNHQSQAAAELCADRRERIPMNGKSMLHFAVEQNMVGIAGLFIEFEDQDVCEAFFLAAKSDNLSVVQMLHSSRFITEQNKQQAFMVAVQSNAEKVCAALADYVSDAAQNGMTALFWAVMHGNERICTICRKLAGQYTDSQALCQAFKDRDDVVIVDSLKDAISERIAQNDRGDERKILISRGSMTASMVACCLNCYKCLGVLPEADLNAVNKVLQLKAIDYAVLNDAYECLHIIGNDRGPQTERLIAQLSFEHAMQKYRQIM